MSDILFVNPPIPGPPEERAFSTNAPPLGIGYLAAILREEGYDVAAIDLAFAADPLAELTAAMNAHDPRIVGFYTSTVSYYNTLRLHEVVRSMSDAKTWVGGPHVSYEYEDALARGGFDVVFLFEAEHSAPEVARAQLRGDGDLAQIGGIAWRQGNGIVKTAPRAREKALDRFPFPARDLFPMSEYTRPGTIMSSRGCPMKCIFCIASTFEDSYRYRSPENVVRELREMYTRWGISDFYLIDNVFTTHRQRAREIARLIREADLPIGFYCVSRVDYATPALMQHLASAGCYRIELGVESASASVIDSIRKRIRIDQVYRAADIILNLGMQPMFTFQVGHPADTLETIEETLDLAQQLRNRGAGTYLAITTPYPGSPMWIDREKYGMTMETSNWEDFRWSNPTFRTAAFTPNDLRRAVYRDAIRVDHDVRAGKIRDPQAAPWLRFRPGAPPLRLPPPPQQDDIAPLPMAPRQADAPDAASALPILQVSR
ncbi:MAG TPA: radical SAM protein [Thermoanaerobaculia bacterium]|nr:radical SAM protein [Thermoanaerobaculia bacterium]